MIGSAVRFHVLLLCGVAAVLFASPLFAWTTVGDGIEYQSFTTSGPNNLFVCRMARSNTNAIIDSMIGSGFISDGTTETVRNQVTRYDDAINWWGQEWGKRNDVVVGINGDFYSSSIPTGGQHHSGWHSKRYGNFGGFSGFGYRLDRTPFIGSCINNIASNQYVTFLSGGTTIRFDGINVARVTDQMMIYTPQYNSKTPTSTSAVEVLVELPKPMTMSAGSNGVVGTIRQIWSNSGANFIPFDHVILSALGTKATQLSAAAVVGQQVRISQLITDYNAPDTCGQNGCNYGTGVSWENTYASVGQNYWFVRGGVLYPPDSVCHPGYVGLTNLNPRTAVGYNATYIYFIVCDGRTTSSVGMGIAQLGQWCIDTLQITEAVNLDGGGSSTMVVNGAVMNVPSDGSERSVANGFAMINIQPKLQSNTFSAGTTVTNTTTNAPCRLGPGTNYASQASIAKNAVGTIVAHNLNGVYAKGAYWWKCTFGSYTGWLLETSLQGAQTPATPVDGTPVASSTTGITWKWSDVSDETGYRVKDTSGVNKSGDLAANTVQWTEGSLVPNTQYTRRVYAFNTYGESSGSTGQSRYTLAKAGESTDGTGATGNVYCTTASKNTWYPAGKTFTFSNPAGFGTGGTWKATKFEYKWNKSTTETWATAGTTWNTGTISLTPNQSDGDYYLHVRAFNGDNTANNTDTLDYGPFKCDVTSPADVTASDEGSYTPSLNTLKANWTASSDTGGSGLHSYEYAVGTSVNTRDIMGWTSAGLNTSVTISGLGLSDGGTYYIQARAKDTAGNFSAVSVTDGIIAAVGVSPISSAWSKANGTEPLSLRNKVVTAKIGDAFWLEEIDRSNAIKVLSGASVAKGNTVSVAGVLGMSGTQRVLLGDVVINSGGSVIIQPLGVTTKWLGGGNYNPATPGITGGVGQYNIGLLVRCWGRVTYSNSADPNNKYFYLDDGSGLSSGGYDGVKVWCGTLTPPSSGTVIVNGIVSSESIGGEVVPILIVRESSDIEQL